MSTKIYGHGERSRDERELARTAEKFVTHTHRSDLSSDDVILPEYVLDDTGATYLPPTPLHEQDSVHPVGAASLLDYLARELHRYREAVSRMGQDIVTLTEEVRFLDAENAALRQGAHVTSRDKTAVYGAETSLEYATLTERYNQLSKDLQGYKDKVHTLENNLHAKLRAEQAETSLAQIRADEELYSQLKHERSRVKKLEDACRRQEEVITEMEGQLAEKSGRDASQELLLTENRRLRAELKRHMEDSRRYYNEYADYLNRYWNPRAREAAAYEDVRFFGGYATRNGNARVRESYILQPKYKSYQAPTDLLRESGYDLAPTSYSQTARDYDVRLPTITTRHVQTTSKTAR